MMLKEKSSPHIQGIMDTFYILLELGRVFYDLLPGFTR